MTVSSTVRSASFTGNAATTVFPFTYKVFLTTDVAVYLTVAGVTTLQVVGTHYTIALNGDQNTSPGGAVTMLTAPPSGATLLLKSIVPITQAAHLTSVGGTVIEEALDRAIIGVQQAFVAIPDAQAAATAASDSAAAAAGSAASAAQSVLDAAAEVVLASNQVTLAAGQVTLASAQKDLATAQAVAAAASALAADGSAVASAASAANAASTLANAVQRTSATGSAQLPVGTTAQRDGSPVAGEIRFNSTLGQFEGYNGTAWSSVGGGATGGGADTIFVNNGQTVTTSYSIPSGQNAHSVGPVTIDTAATVTIPTGSRWVIS